MTITASTPADPRADFERAARQAIRLVTPARLRLITSLPRTPAKAGPSTDAEVEALAISIGVLSLADTDPADRSRPVKPDDLTSDFPLGTQFPSPRKACLP